MWNYVATPDAEARRPIGVIVWGTTISVTPFLALQVAAGTRDVFSTFGFWAWAPEVTLAPGDTPIVYSDGVTEAMDDDEEMYGEERLLALARRVRSSPIDEVVTTIINEVQLFSGTVQEDDLTLVVGRAR